MVFGFEALLACVFLLPLTRSRSRSKSRSTGVAFLLRNDDWRSLSAGTKAWDSLNMSRKSTTVFEFYNFFGFVALPTAAFFVHKSCAANGVRGKSGLSVMDFAGADQTKDKRQLEEIFVLSNASGNGLLSIPELQGVLELMGKRCQQHEVLSMVASVNSRATNDLNFDEFVKLMDALIDRPYTEAEIDEAFESMATSHSDPNAGSTRYISTDRFRVRRMHNSRIVLPWAQACGSEHCCWWCW